MMSTYRQAVSTIRKRMAGIGAAIFLVFTFASAAGENESAEPAKGPRLSTQVFIRPIPASLVGKLQEKRDTERPLPEKLPIVVVKLFNDGFDKTRFPTLNMGREFIPAMDGKPHVLTLEWNDPPADTDGYSMLRPSTAYAMVDLPYKHGTIIGGDVGEFSLSLFDLVAGYAERAEKLDRQRLADGSILIRYRVQPKFAETYGTWTGLLESDSGLCVKDGILGKSETAEQN